MRIFAGRAAWLIAVWLFLWGEVSVGNLLAGTAVACAVLLIFPPRQANRRGRVRPLAALRFFAFFSWRLVQSNLVVAWEIVTPRNRINEGVVAVPIRHFSEALTTVLANSISLTPGTLTIEVFPDPTVLYVHVLHLRDVEEVRQDVQKLELMVVKAFGSEEAIRESIRDVEAAASERRRGGRR